MNNNRYLNGFELIHTSNKLTVSDNTGVYVCSIKDLDTNKIWFTNLTSLLIIDSLFILKIILKFLHITHPYDLKFVWVRLFQWSSTIEYVPNVDKPSVLRILQDDQKLFSAKIVIKNSFISYEIPHFLRHLWESRTSDGR